MTTDAIGNLTNDGTWSYSWQHGRQLEQMSRPDASGDTEMIRFRYDSSGHRIGKDSGIYHISYSGGEAVYAGETTRTSYSYLGDTLTQVNIDAPTGSTSLHFTYDEIGPMSVTYNGAEYFYLKNAQGDVTGLVNNSGTQVVAYTYDAWGNPLSTTGTMADTLGKLNPFRYRGYVYDTETGLYYLGSRYYNPETGRFINADGYVSTGQGVLEKNMYAYCLNNPVNMFDPSGEIAITTLILIGSIVAGVAVASYTAYTSHKYTGKVDWNNTILSGLSTFAFCYTCGMSAYGMYVSYCDYKGYAPVTNIGTSPKTNPAPYSNLTDPSNVAPGKDFTASQKAQIIQQNKLNNNGVVKSDLSGQILVPPQKSMKGVTPPTNEWQIDHIIPKSAGGTNSFSNAQVLSREENRIKWDH